MTRFVRSRSSREISTDLRRAIERIVAGDPIMLLEPGEPMAPGSGRSTQLNAAEKERLLLELLKSVDENAERRGRATGRGEALAGSTLDRYEEWAITDPEGTRRLLLLSVLRTNAVLISYEVLEEWLTSFGYEKQEALG